MRKILLVLLLLVCTTMVGTAYAQIAFRAASSASLETTTITLRGAGAAAEINPAATGACAATQFITPPIPAGSEGDLLVAVVHNRDNATLTPSGATWNTLHTDDQTNHRTRVYWRLATGTDALTVTKTGTCTVNGVMIGQVARYNGVDIVQPLEPVVRFGYQTAAAVVNHAGGTINATVANSLSLFAAMVSDNNTVNAPTPATFTAAFNTLTGTGNDATIALFHKLETTTGSKGAYASTMSATDPSTGVFAIVRGALGLTIPVPAGTAVGDLMIASVTMRPCSNAALPCTVTVAAHADWTLVDSRLQPAGGGTGGNGNQLLVYRRVVTGTEPVAYTWTVGGAPVHSGAAGGILSFSGVDTASPIVAQLGALTASASSHTAPQIDTGLVANTMLVSTHASNSSTTWVSPGGMTERVDASSREPTDDLGLAIEMNTELRALAGLTGTRTATYTTPGTPANDTGATHMLALRPAATVGHYRVQNNATGVNCQAENVTITAHNSAHAAVAATGQTITVTALRVAGAAGTHGDWTLVTGTGVLTNGAADDGVATYAFAAGENNVVLALKDTRVQTVNIAVTGGTATDTSGTANADAGYNQDLAFVNSGFRITDGSGAPAPINIGTQIAGTTSVTYGLQAIRTDTSTGACVGAFAGGTDVTIDLAFQCNNPVACIAGQNVTITNNAVLATIASNPNVPAIVATYTARSLRFGANSQALFTLNYPDAGLISLHARYNIPLGTGASSGNFMTGTSNQFVVKPASFTLSNIRQTAAPNTVNPAAVDATGARFVKAGEAFSVTVTARNSAGNATPNYGQETTPEAVRLTSGLVAGLGLTNNPALGSPTAFGVFTAGVATGTTFNWGDVGIITLTPTVGDADYLGVGQVTGTASGNVGRFYPDHFAVTRNTPVFNPACTAGNFTYIGQPFIYATAPVITVIARNVAGAVTLNYSGTSPASQAWWKITNAALTGKTYSAASGTLDITGLPVTDPVIVSTGAGSGNLTFGSGTGLLFTRSTPLAPFDAEISLAINVGDSDSTVVANIDGIAGINPVRFGAASGGNGIAFTGGAIAKRMRFGRLFLGNGFGSVLLDLPLLLRTEYYDGSFFIPNAEDSCTTLLGSDISLAFVAGTNLSACETRISPAATINFSAGRAAAWLTKPGSGNEGAVDLTINLGPAASGNTCVAPGPPGPAATTANRPYLRGNWQSGPYSENPKGRYSFGQFKGADQFIYLREVH
ncbi:MAG: DUF6701 domain-containing protein [Burkholderiales bacterium]